MAERECANLLLELFGAFGPKNPVGPEAMSKENAATGHLVDNANPASTKRGDGIVGVVQEQPFGRVDGPTNSFLCVRAPRPAEMRGSVVDREGCHVCARVFRNEGRLRNSDRRVDGITGWRLVTPTFGTRC